MLEQTKSKKLAHLNRLTVSEMYRKKQPTFSTKPKQPHTRHSTSMKKLQFEPPKRLFQFCSSGNKERSQLHNTELLTSDMI